MSLRTRLLGPATMPGRVFTVDAGGCGGCLAELRRLAARDPAGAGSCASPRHASVLAVTGPVTRPMADALTRASASVPDATPVLAVGDCAIDGGVFRGSPPVVGGVAEVIPGTSAVPGCPPPPGRLRAAISAR